MKRNLDTRIRGVNESTRSLFTNSRGWLPVVPFKLPLIKAMPLPSSVQARISFYTVVTIPSKNTLSIKVLLTIRPHLPAKARSQISLYLPRSTCVRREFRVCSLCFALERFCMRQSTTVLQKVNVFSNTNEVTQINTRSIRHAF